MRPCRNMKDAMTTVKPEQCPIEPRLFHLALMS